MDDCCRERMAQESCCNHGGHDSSIGTHAEANGEGRIVVPNTGGHDTPWKFYNHLIGKIPEDILVTGCCVGSHWTYVEAESGMGLSYTMRGGSRRNFTGDLIGHKLVEVAELSKSWNFLEATIGVAALNAWYSTKERIDALGAIYDSAEGGASKEDIFDVYLDRIKDKKVTVIGHFPHLDRVAQVADLTILERDCSSPDDVPDPACEYIIPKQDFLFMTGTTIINKTAPRLFELSKDITTVMVGPSVVPSDFLFKWGVECLGGSVVLDPEQAKRVVMQGSTMPFCDGIRMFRINRPD